MQNKKIKKIAVISLISLSILLLLSIIGYFSFRNILLNKAIAKIADKIEHDYNSSLTVESAAFSDFLDIELKNTVLLPKNTDTLFSIESIKTTLSFSNLLTGEIQLEYLDAQNGYIQFIKNEHGHNFDAFIKQSRKAPEPEIKTSEKNDYAKRAYRIFSQILNLVPTEMKLNNLSLRINDEGKKVNMHLQDLILSGKNLVTTIEVDDMELQQVWKVKGLADPRNKKADLTFFNSDTARIQVPYINKRYGLLAGFDSIHVNIDEFKMKGREFQIKGFASIANFMVNNPKIARKDVIIDKARFDYSLLFGIDFVSIDSTSLMEFNNVKIIPFAKYSTNKDTVYQLKMSIPKMKAQDFIESLPEGLFTNFKGMEAQGNFSYTLNFEYNKNNAEGLIFDSNLKKENLNITKYGAANLNKLNSAFVYRAIENGRPQRAIIVGTENPFYVPLQNISPYLQKAILTSEDPSFYHHRGFITEAFRQSIIKNIKTKKFARGASTISMQLVKNAFLTREKTLSRKLEEILLVYILENNRIVSKERMFEVYLNIIEWGPNVYGIGEAANFYFQKHPNQLTLEESIYLATIIPRPKGFMWRFDDQGNLKEFAKKQNDFLTNIMMRRNLLVAEDTISGKREVMITGAARSLLRLKPDAEEQQSLPVDEFDF